MQSPQVRLGHAREAGTRVGVFAILRRLAPSEVNGSGAVWVNLSIMFASSRLPRGSSPPKKSAAPRSRLATEGLLFPPERCYSASRVSVPQAET